VTPANPAIMFKSIARWIVRHGIGVALTLTLGIAWSLIIFFAILQERRLLEINTRELTQLNSVVAQHSYALFNSIETDLRTLDQALHWQAGIDPISDPRFIAMVAESRRASGGLIDVRAMSADGKLYQLPAPDHKPSADIADRPVFIAAMATKQPPLHIGLPIVSRVNGRLGIPISWRLSSPVGNIVALEVFVELDRLIALHDQFRAKQEGTINIFRTDGYMLSRAPYDARFVGRNFTGTAAFDDDVLHKTQGTLISTGQATDGVTRILSFERLNGYPLVVVVTRGVNEVLGEYHRRVFELGIVAIIASLILIARAAAFKKSIQALHDARKDLKLSLLEQRAIFDNALTGIVFVKQRIIQRCNSGCENMFGYGPGELIGQSFQLLFMSEEEFETRRDVMYQRLAERESVSADRQYKHKDGHLIWCHTYVKLIDKDDPDGGMVFVMHDITARKEIEQTLEQANQKLAELSTTDGLTGLANRRKFNEVGQNEWQRALRKQEPLAVAMIDIDYFKAYNDHYGHQAGDQCLHNIAQTLLIGLRGGGDFIARYGGEEFIIILPGQDARRVGEVLNPLRSKVEALALPHAASKISNIVTFSAGYMTVVPQKDSTLSALVEQADQNLYHAKRNGRNQVYGE
jgi:diguanylate cyclase (GGDEF)-like protein/PAS domain S-box-containing protein